MNAPGRPGMRRWLALAAAGLALLLGGCVYLRLLELKHQLGQFDRHFALQTGDGLGLICHTPLLLTSDLRWLGLKPEEIRKLGQAEHWQVRWVKELPPGRTETPRLDILLELSFAHDKLTRVTIPERYFALVPKDFVVSMIKGLGRGRVDKSARRFETELSGAQLAAARPRLPAIDKLLGAPSEQRTEGPRSILRYRYVTATKEPDPGVFDMQLTFDRASGDLVKWQGFTPVGRITFDFAGDRPKP